MNPRNLIVSSESAPDDGLVRYDHDLKPSLLDFSKGCFDTWKNFQLIRSLYVIWPFPGKNTVPVEKDCPRQGQGSEPLKLGP